MATEVIEQPTEERLTRQRATADYVLTELGESDVIRGVVPAGFESNVGELLG